MLSVCTAKEGKRLLENSESFIEYKVRAEKLLREYVEKDEMGPPHCHIGQSGGLSWIIKGLFERIDTLESGIRKLHAMLGEGE